MGYAPGFLEARPGAAAQDKIDDAQRDRHHHRRARGIGNPHAQERGDRHEAAHDRARPRADQLQGEEGDAPVEPPTLDRKPNDKTAHEQEDHVGGVRWQYFTQGRNAQQREGCDGQERRNLDIDGFRDPPRRHPDHHAEGSAASGRELDPLPGPGRVLKRQQMITEQRQQRAAEQPHPFDPGNAHSSNFLLCQRSPYVKDEMPSSGEALNILLD